MINLLKIFYKNLIVFKEPEFEDDSFYIRMLDFQISESQIEYLESLSPYLKLKMEKFQNKDITGKGFEEFSEERLSLRELKPDKLLTGTIYTYSVIRQNNLLYENIISKVKEIVSINPRRAALRFASSIREYYDSLYRSVDVTCLNMIYYGESDVKLVFRASDIKDELFTDIITIYNFFIKPIYNEKKITLDIFASTSQNFNNFKEIL